MRLLKENQKVKKLQRNWGNVLLALSESSQFIEHAINILSYTI
jgi:hypothetical protein